jgi:formylmethanofuran--tetrahydromethanopterin N-formyltransferase
MPNTVPIIDTYAEAFGMWCCRIIVTACDSYWVKMAVAAATGYGTSIIGCDCEAGVETYLSPEQTPDGRPGAAMLFFAFKADALTDAVVNRAGQCLMTTPTTTVFDGFEHVIDDEDTQTKRVPLGDWISCFGDGFESHAQHAGRDCWAIPVMEGMFHVQRDMGMCKGVGGGNLLLCGANQRITLRAAKDAVDAARSLPGVIAPFPGGVVRCGSKVGSMRNPDMVASTNHHYCPAVANQSDSLLPPGTTTVYELIFDGIDLACVEQAMCQAMQRARRHELVAITAGNYGGNLGKHRIGLRALLPESV